MNSNFCIAHSNDLYVLKGKCSVWVENFGKRKYLLEPWCLLRFLVCLKGPLSLLGPHPHSGQHVGALNKNRQTQFSRMLKICECIIDGCFLILITSEF